MVLAEQARQDDHFIEGVDIDEYLRKLMEKAEFVADHAQGRLRGLVAYYCNDVASHRAYISLVLVDPSDRGYGLGKALVNCVLEIAKRRGFATCRLEVGVRNHVAYAAYRVLGFTLVEERGNKHLLEAAL